MSKNILVTGSNGQLGSDIKIIAEESEHNFYFTDVNQLNICDVFAIEEFVTSRSIDVIINCAAYTAVDKAEEDADKAYEINQLAVRYLAEVSNKNNCYLIQISTDFVFDGETSVFYNEDAQANPINVYGKSKLAGEKEISDIVQNSNGSLNAVILRTSWLYSSFGDNFVKTIKKIAIANEKIRVVNNQIGTPTYSRDLAKVISLLIEKDELKGLNVFNYSNEGVASWYDFAKAIVDVLNIDCEIVPIPDKDYPTPAARPKFCVLDKTKIKDTLGITVPYWRDSLNEYVKDLLCNSISF